MKKLLIVLLLFLFSCSEEEGKREVQFSNISYTISTTEVKGHEYIVASCTHSISIIHSYSCKCYGESKMENEEGEETSSFLLI